MSPRMSLGHLILIAERRTVFTLKSKKQKERMKGKRQEKNQKKNEGLSLTLISNDQTCGEERDREQSAEREGEGLMAIAPIRQRFTRRIHIPFEMTTVSCRRLRRSNISCGTPSPFGQICIDPLEQEQGLLERSTYIQ